MSGFCQNTCTVGAAVKMLRTLQHDTVTGRIGGHKLGFLAAAVSGSKRLFNTLQACVGKC